MIKISLSGITLEYFLFTALGLHLDFAEKQNAESNEILLKFTWWSQFFSRWLIWWLEDIALISVAFWLFEYFILYQCGSVMVCKNVDQLFPNFFTTLYILYEKGVSYVVQSWFSNLVFCFCGSDIVCNQIILHEYLN